MLSLTKVLFGIFVVIAGLVVALLSAAAPTNLVTAATQATSQLLLALSLPTSRPVTLPRHSFPFPNFS